jgi:hypothetical protein
MYFESQDHFFVKVLITIFTVIAALFMLFTASMQILHRGLGIGLVLALVAGLCIFNAKINIRRLRQS